MKELLLVRHAKSDWGDPSLDDFDRPLNGRGKRDAPVMAEKIKERGKKSETNRHDFCRGV
jgi:phosphohistidine phosphatase